MKGQTRGLKIVAALVLGALAVSTGCAPYGGAPLIAAHSDRKPIPGYRIANLDIVGKEKGALIHGRICRTNVTAYPISRLSVEHLGPDGRIIERAEAYLYGMSSWRKPACGYFSAETNWKVDRSDTIGVGLPRDTVS